MRKIYRTIDDVLRSPWGAIKHQDEKAAATDRVLRSTKLEDSIYADLRNDDPDLDQIEQAAAGKLTSFPALTRDIYQSFYSLMPRRQDADALSTAARRFNAPILDHILENEDYPTLKAVCEGRELPAYEAASEFAAQTANELDGLLSGLGGEKGAVNTLEKLGLRKKRRKRSLPHCWSGCARAKSLTRRWNGRSWRPPTPPKESGGRWRPSGRKLTPTPPETRRRWL